jgi:alkanesulfonate monooxygenase
MLGDTIDFGRYVIPLVREEVAKRATAAPAAGPPARDALAVDG